MADKKITSYMNLKGTTLPSFKMGKNGIEFYSDAVPLESSQETLKALFLRQPTSVIPDEEELKALADAGTPYVKDYDIAVTSKNIKKFYATKGISGGVDTLTIVLANGEKIVLNQRVTADTVLVLPQDAYEGEIATYGKDEFGYTTMTRSERSFTDSITDDFEAESQNSNIPSVKAVVNHLNDVTMPFGERLQGDNVSSTKK